LYRLPAILAHQLWVLSPRPKADASGETKKVGSARLLGAAGGAGPLFQKIFAILPFSNGLGQFELRPITLCFSKVLKENVFFSTFAAMLSKVS
jgi:hypothetical protein